MRTTVVTVLGAILLTGCASGPFKQQTIAPAFAKGDTAIAHGWTGHPQYEGELVTVTGDFRWRWVKELQGNAMRVYEVQTSDGQKFAAQEFQLAHVK